MRGCFGIGAEGISKPMNLGNLIRSAHAFGASFALLIDAHHTVSSASSDTSQTPHPVLPGFGTPTNTPTVIDYHEGAEVGYRWLARTGDEPLYANQTNPTAAAIRADKAKRAIARTRAARHAGATRTHTRPAPAATAAQLRRTRASGFSTGSTTVNARACLAHFDAGLGNLYICAVKGRAS